MSAYYIIGCNSKLINNKLYNFKELDLKKTDIPQKGNSKIFDKNFYFVLGPLYQEFGYTLINYNDFDEVEEQREDFLKFIEYMKENLNFNDEIDFFRLWSIDQNPRDEINEIYEFIQINLSEFIFPYDGFEFKFHTKYTFIK